MPNDREKLSQEYAESLLRLAMTSYAEQEGRAFMEEARKLREVPDAPRPNPDEISILNKLIAKKEHGHAVRKVGFSPRKLVLRILVAAVILATTISVSLAVSSDFRSAFFDWLFVRQEKLALITQNTPHALVPAPRSTLGEHAKFAPTLLPSDFKETDAGGTSLAWINHYSDTYGNYIEFYQSQTAKMASYKGNSEGADLYEEFNLENGSRAVLYINDDIVTMVWETDESLLRIKSDLDNRIVKQIALAVEKIK